jgi:hypothetical protein
LYELQSDLPVEFVDSDPGTSAVSMYIMEHAGLTVHLIDTPGLNDTYRSESDVLKEVSFWLSKAYASDCFLNGIIYLHDISAPRWTASTKRGLIFLKALCGAENYDSIVLLTTKWDLVPLEKGKDRQRELVSKPEMWGDLEARGSFVYPHSTGRVSALSLIEHIIFKNKKYLLAIQRELRNGSDNLNDTELGREISRLWQEEVNDLNEQRRQLVERDTRRDAAISRKQIEASISEFKSDIDQKIAIRRSDIESTRRTHRQLHQEWERNARLDLEAVQRRLVVNQDQIIAMEQRMKDQDVLQGQIDLVQSLSSDLERLRSEENALYRAKKAKMAAHGTRVSEASMAFGAGSLLSEVFLQDSQLRLYSQPAPSCKLRLSPSQGSTTVENCISIYFILMRFQRPRLSGTCKWQKELVSMKMIFCGHQRCCTYSSINLRREAP